MVEVYEPIAVPSMTSDASPVVGFQRKVQLCQVASDTDVPNENRLAAA